MTEAEIRAQEIFAKAEENAWEHYQEAAKAILELIELYEIHDHSALIDEIVDRAKAIRYYCDFDLEDDFDTLLAITKRL